MGGFIPISDDGKKIEGNLMSDTIGTLKRTKLTNTVLSVEEESYFCGKEANIIAARLNINWTSSIGGATFHPNAALKEIRFGLNFSPHPDTADFELSDYIYRVVFKNMADYLLKKEINRLRERMQVIK